MCLQTSHADTRTHNILLCYVHTTHQSVSRIHINKLSIMYMYTHVFRCRSLRSVRDDAGLRRDTPNILQTLCTLDRHTFGYNMTH